MRAESARSIAPYRIVHLVRMVHFVKMVHLVKNVHLVKMVHSVVSHRGLGPIPLIKWPHGEN